MLSSCAGISNAHVTVYPHVVEFAVGFAQKINQHSRILPKEGLKAGVATVVIISPV